MLPITIKSPVVSSITALAVAAGGLALTAPAASAHTPLRPHSSITTSVSAKAHHRDETPAECTAAGRPVKAARKAVRAAHGPRATHRAKSRLAHALLREATTCVDSVALDDLLAMLPDDVAAQVQELVDEIDAVLSSVAEDMPGANAAQLDAIIRQLTSMDADQIVTLLITLLSQLEDSGTDPQAVASVLATVLAGMTDPGTSDPGTSDPGTSDPGDGSVDPGDLDNGGQLPDLATLLQHFTDFLMHTDLSDLSAQWNAEIDRLVTLLTKINDQVGDSYPELQTLIDLFDQLGFGNADTDDQTDVVNGFGGILGLLLDEVGHGRNAIANGIGSIVDNGGLVGVVRSLFGGAQSGLAGLFGVLGGLFGGGSGHPGFLGGFLGGILFGGRQA